MRQSCRAVSMLTKIVTGGQTGADQAAWRVAKSFGVEWGATRYRTSLRSAAILIVFISVGSKISCRIAAKGCPDHGFERHADPNAGRWVDGGSRPHRPHT